MLKITEPGNHGDIVYEIEYSNDNVRNVLLRHIEKLQARIDSAPVAIMDTRDALGLCAPTEEDFPALYAIQGKRVRLVLDDVIQLASTV